MNMGSTINKLVVISNFYCFAPYDLPVVEDVHPVISFIGFKTKRMSDNAVDPLETMLKRTGCIELHYKVQECIAETQDWRKCQDQVKEFKQCMLAYTNRQREKYDKSN